MTSLLLAVVLAISDRGILVAHDGSIELFDRTATNRIWTAEGLPTPSRIVTSNQQAVIIDPLASQIRMIDLASGRGSTLRTGETPIDGTFLNGRQLRKPEQLKVADSVRIGDTEYRYQE